MKSTAKSLVINQDNIAWVFLIFEATLMIYRDITGVSVNKIVFIMISLIVLCLCRSNKIYELITFLIPLFPGLPGTYIACIAVVLVILKTRNNIKIDAIGMIACFGLLIIELLSVFGGQFVVIDYFRFVGPFLLTFYFIFSRDGDYDYFKIAQCFILGSVIAIIDILWQMSVKYGVIQVFTLGVRVGNIQTITGENVEGMTLIYNANNLGVLCAVVSAMSLIMISSYKKRSMILILPLCLLCGTMTQSRTFFVCLVVGAIFYIILGNDKSTSIVKKLSFFSCICIACLVLIKKLIPNYLQQFIERFHVDDLSNGRVGINRQYWEGFINNADRIPFGVGLQNYPEKYNVSMGAHFGFEEVLITWGIVGLLLVVIIIIRMLRSLNYQEKKNYTYIVPFLIMLLGIQSGQFFSNTVAYLSFIGVYAFSKIPLTPQTEGI